MITIVAVHGNGGGGFRFSRLHGYLPATVRFEAVTLPGFGGRAADPELRTLTDYAEALWSEIADLPRPLVLLGHGIGGSIALDLLQRHPVDGLILHSPVGTRLDSRLFPKVMKPAAVRRLVRWGISSKLTRPLLRRRFFGGAVPAAYADRFLAEYGRAESFGQMFDIITKEWWDSLQPTDTPSLLLWGADDRVLGSDQLDDYRTLLPQHAVDVVSGWGHFPMATDPKAYATRIADWAQRLAGDRTPQQPLTLGSGDASRHGIAPKAEFLDRAAAAGLPVPSGIVVPDAAGIDTVPPWLGDSLAVRSAFGSEDGESTSMAGRFKTLLRVDPPDIFAAVTKVRASGTPDEYRRDVLVMRMVEATAAGVAFSEPGYEDDLVESVAGTAEGLVGGTQPGTSLRLPRLRSGEQAGCGSWKSRLATLLRDIRTVFGDKPWDIEWADDGIDCWLIQIRPITVPARRDEWFTMANHREILPDPPSPFMTSLIAEGAPQLLDYYRRFDPSLSDDRLFIEVFDHRPMINLSLMTDFMRSLGLPTRLVTDSIGGGGERDHGSQPMRMVRRFPVLLRLAWAQLTAARYAQSRLAMMSHLTAPEAQTLGEVVDRARTVYVATVHGMTALNTAAAAPTRFLRAVGTLEAHGARQQTAATEMFRELDSLRELLTAEERSALQGGNLPQSASFRRTWSLWLNEHGHRGPYESDLSRPRYVDDPSPVLDVLAIGHPFDRHPPRWTWRQILTLPVWWLARRPMAQREQFRSQAMRTFFRLRNDLIRLGASRGLAEQDLWLLTAGELRRVDDGWSPSPDLLEERQSSLAEAKSRQMPDLISRFGSQAADAGGRNGVGLVAGLVEGVAWVLDEPSTRPPAELAGNRLVLVAPSVDAGWLPTFSLVDAVVVEMGGDLSHGSIILREVGLPAVTNLSGLRSHVRTGDPLLVDGNRGNVEVGSRNEDP